MNLRKLLLGTAAVAVLLAACKKDEISSGFRSTKNHYNTTTSDDQPAYFGEGLYLMVYDENGNIISPDYSFLENHPAIVNAFNIAVTNTPGVYINLSNSNMNTTNGFTGVPMGFDSQGDGTLVPVDYTGTFGWPVPATIYGYDNLLMPYDISGPASGNTLSAFGSTNAVRSTGRVDIDNLDFKNIGWTEGDHAHSWPHKHKGKKGLELIENNDNNSSIGWTEGDHIRIRKYYGLPDAGSPSGNSIGWTEGDHIRIRKEAFTSGDGDKWVIAVDEAQKSAPHLYFNQYTPSGVKVYSATNKNYYPIVFDYKGKVISSSISTAPAGSYIQNLLSDAGGLKIFTGSFTFSVNSNGYQISNNSVWESLPEGFKNDLVNISSIIKSNIEAGHTLHVTINENKSIAYSMTDENNAPVACNLSATYASVNAKSGHYWYLPVIGTLPEALLTAADQKGWL